MERDEAAPVIRGGLARWGEIWFVADQRIVAQSAAGVHDAERDRVIIRQRAVRLRERMNSPLEKRKVRLRGLGGPAVCGVSRTCASAPTRCRRCGAL
jgi:hypothetical protein